jgi:hypothetical protein
LRFEKSKEQQPSRDDYPAALIEDSKKSFPKTKSLLVHQNNLDSDSDLTSEDSPLNSAVDISCESENRDPETKIIGVCKTTGKPCLVCLSGKPCKWVGLPGHLHKQTPSIAKQGQPFGIQIDLTRKIEGVCKTTGKPCLLCSNGKDCEWIGFPGHLKSSSSNSTQNASQVSKYAKFIDGVCKTTQKPCILCLNGKSCKWIGRPGHLRASALH